MALKFCPKCGGSVSDKASSCPHCNTELVFPEMTVCAECGAEYECTFPNCPKCGNPTVLKRRKKKNKAVIIAASIGAVVLAALVIAAVTVIQKGKEEKYCSDMISVTDLMSETAVTAESLGNITCDVWNNAIMQRESDSTDAYTIVNGEFVEDFNEALDNLFSDENYIKSVEDVKAAEIEAFAAMKRLSEPPKKYEEAYAALMAWYDSYCDFISASLETGGKSYKTYSEDFLKYDEECAELYKEFAWYLH